MFQVMRILHKIFFLGIFKTEKSFSFDRLWDIGEKLSSLDLDRSRLNFSKMIKTFDLGVNYFTYESLG